MVRTKEEVKNDDDELLDDETKIFRLWTDLKHEKSDLLHNVTSFESKSIKSEISPKRIDRIKNSVSSTWFKSMWK